MQNVQRLRSIVDGVAPQLSDNIEFCDVCATTKSTCSPFTGTRTVTSRPLERVHTDVHGPSNPTGYDGSRYFVSFIDDHTHLAVVFTMKNKSEVLECFKCYHAMATAHFNLKLARLRCDNGGEYTSNAMKNFCSENGIVLEFTPPHTAELNGVAERYNRTLLDRVRPMLKDMNVAKFLWPEAVHTANYLINRSPTTAIKDNKTPYEMWFGRRPNMSHIRVFGSRAFVHMRKEQRNSKLSDRATERILVGYSDTGYRLWGPHQPRSVISHDVKFNEDPRSIQHDHEEYHNKIDNNAKDDLTVEEPSNNDKVQPVPPQNPAELPTRPQRQRRPPDRFGDYETYMACSASLEVDDIPINYDDVQGRHDEAEWRKAINSELQSMAENQTWEVVRREPNMKPLTSRWVFRKKNEADGSARYKARLVVRGFLQKEGVDFTETYAPVARLPTVRTMLVLGLQNKHYIRHLDVTTAFLYGDLEEIVYMAPPDGVDIPNDHVLRLKKSIYGLKQAPRCWNTRFHRFITSIGFKQSSSDYCLYVREQSNSIAYLLVYVDDVLIQGDDPKVIDEIIKRLSSEFKMKNLGSPRLFMGLSINLDNDRGTLTVGQSDGHTLRLVWSSSAPDVVIL